MTRQRWRCKQRQRRQRGKGQGSRDSGGTRGGKGANGGGGGGGSTGAEVGTVWQRQWRRGDGVPFARKNWKFLRWWKNSTSNSTLNSAKTSEKKGSIMSNLWSCIFFRYLFLHIPTWKSLFFVRHIIFLIAWSPDIPIRKTELVLTHLLPSFVGALQVECDVTQGYVTSQIFQYSNFNDCYPLKHTNWLNWIDSTNPNLEVLKHTNWLDWIDSTHTNLHVHCYHFVAISRPTGAQNIHTQTYELTICQFVCSSGYSLRTSRLADSYKLVTVNL
jgi:hypothetical protein